MKLRKSVRLAMLAFLLISAWAFAPREQRPSGLTSTHDVADLTLGASKNARRSDLPLKPPAAQRLYAPLPKGVWSDAQIVLNNNSPASMIVTPTLYTHDGPANTTTPITLQPAEVRWLPLSDLDRSTEHNV